MVKDGGLKTTKRRAGVPEALESCHTVVAGPYFVEGHVPAAAVARLLAERPRILGIALPGMPSGSPGMDGPRHGPLVVYAVTSPTTWREFARF